MLRGTLPIGVPVLSSEAGKPKGVVETVIRAGAPVERAGSGCAIFGTGPDLFCFFWCGFVILI